MDTTQNFWGRFASDWTTLTKSGTAQCTSINDNTRKGIKIVVIHLLFLLPYSAMRDQFEKMESVKDSKKGSQELELKHEEVQSQRKSSHNFPHIKKMLH